ncbi:MAG: dihydrolipoamide acetyltransferase family protein [Steroidobacteraceae bacterium]
MSQPLYIPKLGLTMEEATIVAWLCERGARVVKGQPYLTIETDKITYDVAAEEDGYLEPVAPVQAVLEVGDLVGYLHATADAARTGAGAPEGAAATAVASPTEPGTAARPPPTPTRAAGGAAIPAATTTAGGRRLISPLARRIAEEHRLRYDDLPGTGPGGVVRRRDVEHAIAARASSRQPLRDAAPANGVDAAGAARRPLTAMRRAIAQRMMQSLQSTAQMTGFGRIDMTDAVAWRTALLAAHPEVEPRVTYTDIVVKACACLLREFPELNSFIDGDDVVTWTDVHVGIAVSVDGGLVVPVIRHADRLALAEIAAYRQALIERARSGRLAPADVEGGTFTVSNFGSYGGDFETAILNAPQSALLGIGRITEEPAVRDGQIVIRRLMMISLTFDHRLIDGARAGRFRARLREYLEHPALMQGWLESGDPPEARP